MINDNELNKIVKLSQRGISVWRVTKLSKIAAMTIIGNMPIVIFMPSVAPFLREANLV